MRAFLLVSPIVAALMFAGCSNDTSLLPFESGAQASETAFAFTTSVLRTAVGDTARLRLARSRRASASDETIRWRVADPTIAGVENGLVFPLSEGSTTITASVSGGAAVATVVTWGAAEVDELHITPSPVSLKLGESAQLDAELSYSNGLRVKLRTSPAWTTLDAGVATVINGKVSGIAPGTARIIAQMGAVADTIVATVGFAPPQDQPKIPSDTAVSGEHVQPTLPRASVDVSLPPVTGRSIRVPAGSNLQSAINDAQPGDEIVLDAGATYTANFTLKKKSGDGWITIRSNGLLPLPGTRVTPADAPQMATLLSPTANEGAIRTEAGAHHYRMIGLEITAAANVTRAGALVNLGDGSKAQNTLEKVPHNLVLDRVYIHGRADLDLRRCVSLQSATSAIVDSWISECHAKGSDSQAIFGSNGPGPYLIRNNQLEGAGENVMFGGDDSRSIELMPRDITISRNHFYKPLEWKGVWTVKNLLELKVGQRVLVEGNVFENNWTDGQTGFAILLKSVNQGGPAAWSETSDVTLRYNIIRRSGNGISIAGRPGPKPAVPASRIAITHTSFEEIGTSTGWGSGKLFQLESTDDLTIEHNTGIGKWYPILFATRTPMHNLIVRYNILGEGDPVRSAVGLGAGAQALASHAPGSVVESNIFVAPTTSPMIPNNWVALTLDDAMSMANRLGRRRTLSLDSAGGIPRRREADGDEVVGASSLELREHTAGVISR